MKQQSTLTHSHNWNLLWEIWYRNWLLKKLSFYNINVKFHTNKSSFYSLCSKGVRYFSVKWGSKYRTFKLRIHASPWIPVLTGRGLRSRAFFETRQDETGGHFPNSRDHFDKTHQNTHSPIVYEIDPFFYVFMSHKYHPCFTFKLNAFITLRIQSLTQPWHKWFWKILPANKAENFSPVLISYQEILQTLAL